MTNEKRMQPVFTELQLKVQSNEFVIDKTGVKTVELLGMRVELDPKQPIMNFGSRKTPVKYCEKELAWYQSKSCCIKDMPDYPSTWDKVASTEEKIVNSNYGYRIWSPYNGNQYDQVVRELTRNPDSRRAIMIYQDPMMHIKYNRLPGMNDFVCTNFHHFFIRNNRLVSITNMRSNDAIYGFFNDFYWFAHVHNLVESAVPNIEPGGTLIYTANSFHVYEPHFQMLKEMTFE